MDDERDLTERLRELGRQPLDPAVQARTTARMGAPGPDLVAVPMGRRWSRPAVAVAALVGFLVGSLGLATAGALPAGLQDTAQSVLDRVGIDVPPGHERYNDPAVCPGGPYKNHGEYVRSHKDDPNAGASPCGKPLQSLDHSSDGTETDTESDEVETDSGKGKGKDKGAKTKNDQGKDEATTTTTPTATPDATSTTTPDTSTTTTTTPATTTTTAPALEPNSTAS